MGQYDGKYLQDESLIAQAFTGVPTIAGSADALAEASGPEEVAAATKKLEENLQFVAGEFNKGKVGLVGLPDTTQANLKALAENGGVEAVMKTVAK